MRAVLWLCGLCMVANAADNPPAAPPRPPSGQFYTPPGEPESHRLLSPMMRPPPGSASAPSAVTPPANPRAFEGAWSKLIGFNALIPDPNRGTWTKPPFTPEGERIFWHRVEMENAGTPVPDAGIKCEPMGLSRAMNAEFGWRVLQTPTRLIWLINEDHLVRRIRIGGHHPRQLQPSYMGDSVAHWDGDTLVVDSVGFNTRTWLDFDGTPHSSRLHVIERLKKFDGGRQMEDEMTIEDPVMYTRPWSVRTLYGWAPISAPAPEIICEENDVELTDYTGKDLPTP
jgi:hypothetical protein